MTDFIPVFKPLLGWNLRMSNLQAAVACAQFEKIDKTIQIKKSIGCFYQKALKNIPAQLSCNETLYASNHYWVFGLVLNNDVKFDAKEAREKLLNENIDTRPFFYPFHKQPVFSKLGILDSIKRPVSQRLYERGFYIPTGLSLNENQLEYITEKIIKLF